MKKSAITDIYFGDNPTYETIYSGDEYWKLLHEVADKYELLEKQLNKEQILMLREIADLDGEQQAEVKRAGFVAGFKLGLLVGIECLD